MNKDHAHLTIVSVTGSAVGWSFRSPSRWPLLRFPVMLHHIHRHQHRSETGKEGPLSVPKIDDGAATPPHRHAPVVRIPWSTQFPPPSDANASGIRAEGGFFPSQHSRWRPGLGLRKIEWETEGTQQPLSVGLIICQREQQHGSGDVAPRPTRHTRHIGRATASAPRQLFRRGTERTAPVNDLITVGAAQQIP